MVRIMNKDENPYEISEEYLAFIGSATFSWSYLDLTFQYFIWDLLNIKREDDNTGFAVTNNMSFDGRAKLAKNLLRLWFQDKKLSEGQYNLFLTDVEEIIELSSRRNKLMHGYFNKTDSGGAEIRHVNTHGKIEHTVHFDTLDRYREFINTCACLNDNFIAHMREISPEP